MTIQNSDYSHFEGTNCYCSPESAAKIRAGLREKPGGGIHFIGTGDYHYISLFRAEMLESPFILVLFDNHSDDQSGAFDSGMLSCGNWVAEVRKLPLCRGDIWIRTSEDIAMLGSAFPEACGNAFISVDLDVLSPEFARTDWDQGSLTLDELKSAVRKTASRYRILAADICGGISESKGGCAQDREVNDAACLAVAEAVCG